LDGSFATAQEPGGHRRRCAADCAARGPARAFACTRACDLELSLGASFGAAELSGSFASPFVLTERCSAVACHAPSARWWVCARPVFFVLQPVGLLPAEAGANGGQEDLAVSVVTSRPSARRRARSAYALRFLCAARLACGAVAPSAASCSRIGRMCCWPTSAACTGRLRRPGRSRCAGVGSARARAARGVAVHGWEASSTGR